MPYALNGPVVVANDGSCRNPCWHVLHVTRWNGVGKLPLTFALPAVCNFSPEVGVKEYNFSVDIRDVL